eukprot:230143-Hanusia_phi.AAC.2
MWRLVEEIACLQPAGLDSSVLLHTYQQGPLPVASISFFFLSSSPPLLVLLVSSFPPLSHLLFSGCPVTRGAALRLAARAAAHLSDDCAASMLESLQLHLQQADSPPQLLHDMVSIPLLCPPPLLQSFSSPLLLHTSNLLLFPSPLLPLLLLSSSLSSLVSPPSLLSPAPLLPLLSSPQPPSFPFSPSYPPRLSVSQLTILQCKAAFSLSRRDARKTELDASWAQTICNSSLKRLQPFVQRRLKGGRKKEEEEDRMVRTVFVVGAMALEGAKISTTLSNTIQALLRPSNQVREEEEGKEQ